MTCWTRLSAIYNVLGELSISETFIIPNRIYYSVPLDDTETIFKPIVLLILLFENDTKDIRYYAC